MAEETTGVRITQQAIYAKQLEHGQTLVAILEKEIRRQPVKVPGFGNEPSLLKDS
jgi:hypothetical protein